MSARKTPALTVTPLEDRSTPALFGLGWVNAQSLTVSFAPDGTDVGGVPSSLAATLDEAAPTDVWKTEIRRAFQAWVPATNVNFRFVLDDRAAFGSDAPLVSPVSRGDIRIAARPLSDNVYMISNPPDPLSDWAGEIVVNSRTAFSVGGGAGSVDLYTAVLHEVGHVLGLEGSDDPAAAMHESYLGPRAGLGATDVAAAQAMYGPRMADRFEGSKSNDTAKRAAALGYATSTGQLTDDDRQSAPTALRADLTRSGDVDHYKFTVPGGTTAKTNLLLRTFDVSQLAGRLAVLDANGNAVDAKAAAGPGQDVSLSLSLTAGQTYTVKVSGGDGRFDTGAYRLAVGSLPVFAMYFSTAASFFTGDGTLAALSTASNGNRGNAIDLGKARAAVSALWDAAGTFTPAAGNTTAFSIKTQAATPSTMLVSVWAGQFTAVRPRVRVTDAAGHELPAAVLRADGYNQVVQVQGVTPNTRYVLEVTNDARLVPPKLGLGVDFLAAPIALQTFAAGTLTGLQNTAARPLAVERSQLFRFELTGQSLTGQQEAYAELTVRNAAGQVVLQIDAGSGETATGDVFLNAGAYTVSVSGATTDGSVLRQVQVTGRMTGLTDPIGPALLDVPGDLGNSAPQFSPPTSPPPTSPPPPPSDLGYIWELLAPAPQDFLWW